MLKAKEESGKIKVQKTFRNMSQGIGTTVCGCSLAAADFSGFPQGRGRPEADGGSSLCCWPWAPPRLLITAMPGFTASCNLYGVLSDVSRN